MKPKIFIFVAGMLLSMSATAQEDRPYASLSFGTQAASGFSPQQSSKTFAGLATSIGAGYTIKGADIGLSLGYYSNHWGGNNLSTIRCQHDGSNTIVSQDIDGTEYNTAFSLQLQVGYDFLHLIKGNWRHHLRPAAGLGYTQWRSSHGQYIPDGSKWRLKYDDQVESGLALSISLAYDFSITRHWDAGAFYERYLLKREQDIMGIRLRYSL